MNSIIRVLTGYKKASAAAKASFWFLIVTFLHQGSQFLTTPFFTRLMSTSDYGVVNVFSTWMGILTPIITLFVGSTAYNKSMMDHEKDLDQYTSSIVFLETISVTLFYFIALIFRNLIVDSSDISWGLWTFMAIYICFNSAYTIWTMQQRYRYKYIFTSVIGIIIFVLGPVLSLVCLKTLHGNKAIIKIISGSVIPFFVAACFYVYLLVKGKCCIKFTYWKEVLVLSLPLIPHSLSMTILSSSDRIMISNLIDYSAAGKYSVGYAIAAIASVIWTAVNSSFMPWSLQQYKSKNYDRINAISIRIIILYSVICLIPICVAPEILKILGSGEYYDAIWTIVPAMLGCMYIGVYSLFCNIEYAVGKTQYIMIGSIIAAMLNIALNYCFIPIFGYIAAAYTTLISYFALSVFHWLIMRRVSKQKIYNIRIIYLIMGVTTMVSLLFQFCYYQTIIRYFVLSALCLVLFVFRKRVLGLIQLS